MIKEEETLAFGASDRQGSRGESGNREKGK